MENRSQLTEELKKIEDSIAELEKRRYDIMVTLALPNYPPHARWILKNGAKAFCEAVCVKMGIDYNTQFHASNRRSGAINARRLCYVILERDCKFTLAKIAKETGRSNHTTIIHSLGVHEDMMHTDKFYKVEFINFEKWVKETFV